MSQERRDALGRRRPQGQNRGLRPLHPLLPPEEESRSVRVAMSRRAWAALERSIAASRAATRPRAIGHLLEAALDVQAPENWLDWQIRKERRLLEQAS